MKEKIQTQENNKKPSPHTKKSIKLTGFKKHSKKTKIKVQNLKPKPILKLTKI
nr:hypothetical protein [Mycoplasmopsis bovis]